MVDAYLDNGHVVAAEVILGICKELGANPVKDFGMIPLYRGGGSHGMAVECDKCGASIGSVDPDEARWVMVRICADCWQG
jgi:hypothetical protein